MSGRRYYLTTFGAWNRKAKHFANSHWLLLDVAQSAHPDDSSQVLALVEADEGVHLNLEVDAGFEALPHPLSPKPLSDRAGKALATHGVQAGATTFDATEALGCLHPLLRHRVF